MTNKKLLSVVLLVGGVLALLVPSHAAAGLKQDQSNRFNAKDVRSLIYEASLGGDRGETLNLEAASMDANGISLRGGSCDEADTWRSFSQTFTWSKSGGELCTGEKSFQDQLYWDNFTYPKLMRDVTGQMFKRTGLSGRKAAGTLMIWSDGMRAIFRFPNMGVPGQIKTIRFDRARVSMTRYHPDEVSLYLVLTSAVSEVAETTGLTTDPEQYDCVKVTRSRVRCMGTLTSGVWSGIRRCSLAFTGVLRDSNVTVKFTRKSCRMVENIRHLSNKDAWEALKKSADPRYFQSRRTEYATTETVFNGIWPVAERYELKWWEKTEICEQSVDVELIDDKAVATAGESVCVPRPPR